MQMKRLDSYDFDKMIIESIDEVYCFDPQTNDLLFFFDQIKSGEITSEADVVYAEGRQGVQLAAFDRNKTAGFSCENGYVQAGALAVQLGSELENGTVAYEVMETVANPDSTLAAGVFTLAENPTGNVKGVYLLGSDGTVTEKLASTKYTQGTTTVETVTVGTITLDESVRVNNKYPSSILVYYNASTNTGKKIVNAGDKFSSNIKLVINFVAQEPCSGDKYLMQCIMPNAKASGTFSLSAGNDPAVHNFEATALLGICSEDKELFTITMV